MVHKNCFPVHVHKIDPLYYETYVHESGPCSIRIILILIKSTLMQTRKASAKLNDWMFHCTTQTLQTTEGQQQHMNLEGKEQNSGYQCVTAHYCANKNNSEILQTCVVHCKPNTWENTLVHCTVVASFPGLPLANWLCKRLEHITWASRWVTALPQLCVWGWGSHGCYHTHCPHHIGGIALTLYRP